MEIIFEKNENKSREQKIVGEEEGRGASNTEQIIIIFKTSRRVSPGQLHLLFCHQSTSANFSFVELERSSRVCVCVCVCVWLRRFALVNLYLFFGLQICTLAQTLSYTLQRIAIIKG